MGKIAVLAFEVANLIAAGEVVDRPASCVKELLENAIDAGSSSVTVEIQRGGVSFIRVTDNGCGMDKDDVPTAILRHATSKIKTAADLSGIETLGFRGEALAAIASVSHLRILTKPHEAPFGTLLEADGGSVVQLTETGCSDGTTIIVEELFYNVPARRKFLKKDSTESSACSTVVEKIALSHPEISIRFISDGEVRFLTSGNGKLDECIYAIYGREVARRSLPVHREENGVRVFGYVSEPDMVRGNRNMENFFINGRYVKSRTASAAVEQAYASKAQAEKFPFCVINIVINPGIVDVNVHPAKLEVKFTNEKVIFDAVYYAVQNALLAEAIRPELALSGGHTENGRQAASSDGQTKPYLTQEEYLAGGKQTDGRNGVPGSSFSYRVDNYRGQAGFHMPDLVNAFVPQDKPLPKREQIPIRASLPLTGKEEASPAKPNKAESSASSAPEPSVEPAEEADEETLLALHRRARENLKFQSLTDYTPSYILSDEEFEEDALPAKEEPPTSEGALVSGAESTETGSNSPGGSENTHPPAAPDEQEPSKEEPSDAPLSPDEIRPEDVPNYIILGEAYNCYVIVQLEDRILMIDKHAAHERILFDQLCRQMRTANRTGQILLTPYDVTLLRAEADAIEEYKEKILALGFAFTATASSVSQITCSITQIPHTLNLNEAIFLFTDLAGRLSSVTATVESASAEFFENRLWQSACKAAIKGGRKYDEIHLKWICDRLLVKPRPGQSVIRTCPHGRPVAFEIKKSSIDRQFGRT